MWRRPGSRERSIAPNASSKMMSTKWIATPPRERLDQLLQRAIDSCYSHTNYWHERLTHICDQSRRIAV